MYLNDQPGSARVAFGEQFERTFVRLFHGESLNPGDAELAVSMAVPARAPIPSQHVLKALA